jgi:hypothetical protein
VAQVSGDRRLFLNRTGKFSFIRLGSTGGGGGV